MYQNTIFDKKFTRPIVAELFYFNQNDKMYIYLVFMY